MYRNTIQMHRLSKLLTQNNLKMSKLSNNLESTPHGFYCRKTNLLYGWNKEDVVGINVNGKLNMFKPHKTGNKRFKRNRKIIKKALGQ